MVKGAKLPAKLLVLSKVRNCKDVHFAYYEPTHMITVINVVNAARAHLCRLISECDIEYMSPSECLPLQPAEDATNGHATVTPPEDPLQVSNNITSYNYICNYMI